MFNQFNSSSSSSLSSAAASAVSLPDASHRPIVEEQEKFDHIYNKIMNLMYKRDRLREKRNSLLEEQDNKYDEKEKEISLLDSFRDHAKISEINNKFSHVENMYGSRHGTLKIVFQDIDNEINQLTKVLEIITNKNRPVYMQSQQQEPAAKSSNAVLR